MITTTAIQFISEVWYRIYTETTTAGVVREVYGKQGGGTGDVRVIETKLNG